MRAVAKSGESGTQTTMTSKGDEKVKVEEGIKLFSTTLGRRRKIAAELWDVVRQMMPPKVKNEAEWKVSTT